MGNSTARAKVSPASVLGSNAYFYLGIREGHCILPAPYALRQKIFRVSPENLVRHSGT
jgi:hypothetical protein